MENNTQQSQINNNNNMAQRRRRGAAKIGSLLLLALGSSVGVAAAFTAPHSSIMTMKVDYSSIMTRRHRTAASTTTSPPSSSQMSRKRSSSSSSSSSKHGGGLDMVCSNLDQQEYEMSVGHAMDVLRSDYPDILVAKPDFSIYDANLELIDPSGVQLNGLSNYKASFKLLHAIVAIFYCPERSGLTFRMCYDKARQNIRIHWNAQVIPKAIFGGYKTTLHVDGISVYEISRNSGNITQHRIEHLLINDAKVNPEQGIFAALRGHAVKSDVDSIPVFNAEFNNPIMDNLLREQQHQQLLQQHQQQQYQHQNNQVFEFHNFHPGSRSLLFSSNEADHKDDNTRKEGRGGGGDGLSAMSSSSNDSDWDALEKKNMARKKFGLDPLTPEEFMDLQEQVRKLDDQQQQRAAASAAEMANKKKKEEGGFFKKLMGNVLEDTCDSNYDCESPEVCCDFGFKKMCCSSGMRVMDGPPRSRYGQLAEVPVIANPGPNYPPPERRGGGYPM